MDGGNFAAPIDTCEMAGERVKCVNDKDPNLVPDMVRHEDKFYEVCRNKSKKNRDNFFPRHQKYTLPFDCLIADCPAPVTCTLNVRKNIISN
jgi:hypothetical protein